jgi:hypothetical protein
MYLYYGLSFVQFLNLRIKYTIIPTKNPSAALDPTNETAVQISITYTTMYAWPMNKSQEHLKKFLLL